MAKFTLKYIEEIKGKIEFYHLEVDGKIQYEEFEESLLRQGGYESELRQMESRMQEMAELRNPMPATKSRKIGNDEYEIKTRNLRRYLFHEKETGRIIVTLTKKHPKSQNADIKKFRKIKTEYLNQRP